MGYYVNPEHGTKEEWLESHGEEVVAPGWPPESGKVLVCLVDNVTYKAAGIAFNQGEFEAFRPERTDMRRRTWYLVSREDVLVVCPGVGVRLV